MSTAPDLYTRLIVLARRYGLSDEAMRDFGALIGDAQASEAALIAGPLRERLRQAEKRLRMLGDVA